MPLSEAVEGYDLSDKMKAQKGKYTLSNPPGYVVAYDHG